MPDLAFLLPPGIDLATGLLLLVVSLIASLITASLSLGGGSLMIAVLSIIVPPSVAVPVHGVIQLGSNGGRAILQRRHIQWDFAIWFVVGSALGAAVGGQIAYLLPENLFKIVIALFILYLVWGPKPGGRARGAAGTTIAGACSSALGMITGVSGPLVIAFLRDLTDRRQIIATHAFLMSSQNFFKAVTFTVLGFSFAAWVPFLAAMIVAGFCGTWLGSKLLDRLPERTFRIAFRIILTVIALDLLRRGAMDWFAP